MATYNTEARKNRLRSDRLTPLARVLVIPMSQYDHSPILDDSPTASWNWLQLRATARRDADAVRCLVYTSDPLMLDDEGDIYGGRHRIQTMIGQGVHRTLLVRLVLLDPVTGQPT